MQIKYDFPGYGMGGVVSQQLSFSLPAREYEDSGELYGAGSATTLSCSNGAVFPVFYVISRSFSEDKLNIVCYDKTYTVECEKKTASET